MTQCVCTSDKTFDQCCRPFLDSGEPAKTPQQLMRSRYSAFALGGYGDYLIETWLPSSSIDLNAAELSSRTLEWQRLDIVDESRKGDRAKVEFRAYFLDQNQQEQVHHEVSRFHRLSGRWFYVDGEILD